MKTTLHYYYLNMDNADDRQAYAELCARLEAMGLRKFDSIAPNHSTWYRVHIRPLDGQAIELETKHLFDNQWNTAPTSTSEKGLRVFDWAEAIYENKRIKQGQWLEQTDEMREIRRNTTKCGYCGAQYRAQQGHVFCDKCLDSAYLKEDELHLLRLLPIDAGFTAKRAPLSDAERAHLLPQYVERQAQGADSRNAKKLREQRARIEREYRETTENARTERDGLLWLMDHGVSIDNVTYYKHTGRFCFGWRSPVSESVKSQLLDVLCEFPFNYDIKSA